jgi:hypothetical protein
MALSWDDLSDSPDAKENTTTLSWDDLSDTPDLSSQYGVGNFAKDAALKLGQGAVGLGQQVVGLSNMASVGQDAIMHGVLGIDTPDSKDSLYQPERAKSLIGNELSDKQKEQDKNLSNAHGLDKFLAAYENPLAVSGAAIESIPSMLAGMGFTKAVATNIFTTAAEAAGGVATEAGAAAGVQAVKDAATKLLAASSGSEGALSAGGIAEEAQRNGKEFSDYSPQALGAGAVTGLIGFGSGKLMGDAATELLTGTNAIKGGLLSKVGKSIGSEGGEEALQSGSDTAFTNSIYDRPLSQGVADSAIEGGIVGAAMGAGMSGANALLHKAPEQQPLPDGFAEAAQDIAKTDNVDDAIVAFKGALETGNESPAWAKPDYTIKPDAQAIVDNRTIPAQDLKSSIDARFQNGGYVPGEAGQVWEAPNTEQAGQKAAKNKAFFQQEQADLQRKMDELSAMEADPRISAENKKAYRAKRIDLEIESRLRAENFRANLGYEVIPYQAGQIENKPFASFYQDQQQNAAAQSLPITDNASLTERADVPESATGILARANQPTTETGLNGIPNAAQTDNRPTIEGANGAQLEAQGADQNPERTVTTGAQAQVARPIVQAPTVDVNLKPSISTELNAEKPYVQEASKTETQNQVKASVTPEPGATNNTADGQWISKNIPTDQVETLKKRFDANPGFQKNAKAFNSYARTATGHIPGSQQIDFHAAFTPATNETTQPQNNTGKATVQDQAQGGVDEAAANNQDNSKPVDAGADKGGDGETAEGHVTEPGVSERSTKEEVTTPPETGAKSIIKEPAPALTRVQNTKTGAVYKVKTQDFENPDVKKLNLLHDKSERMLLVPSVLKSDLISVDAEEKAYRQGIADKLAAIDAADKAEAIAPSAPIANDVDLPGAEDAHPENNDQSNKESDSNGDKYDLSQLGEISYAPMNETHTKYAPHSILLSRIIPYVKKTLGIPNALKRLARMMPTFQGGKTKMAYAITDKIIKFFGDDAKKITVVDDWFGGGGGWGGYLASGVFDRVKTIRIHKFDPGRMNKIMIFHQHGNELSEILASSKFKPLIERLITAVSESETYSGSGISNRIDRAFVNSDFLNELDTVSSAIITALKDQGDASYGVYGKGESARHAVEDLVGRVINNANSSYKMFQELQERGVKVEYIIGDSYTHDHIKGDHVLSIIDPPYYATKGYNDEKIVKIDTYNKTRLLIGRVVKDGNSLIYTDEAWFDKANKKTGETVIPTDMAKKVDGLDAKGQLLDILGRLDTVFRTTIDSRIETVGLYNGTIKSGGGRNNSRGVSSKGADQAQRQQVDGAGESSVRHSSGGMAGGREEDIRAVSSDGSQAGLTRNLLFSKTQQITRTLKQGELKAAAKKLSLTAFLNNFVSEVTPAHIDAGITPHVITHAELPVDTLTPSEWDAWDDYKSFTGNTMKGSKGKIANLTDAIKSGNSISPVLVNNNYSEPSVIDGHHRVAAHIAAGKSSIPVTYDIETLIKLWRDAHPDSVVDQKSAYDNYQRYLIKNSASLKKSAFFSKAQSTTENPHTEATLLSAIRKALDGKFYDGWTEAVMATGKFKLIDSNEAVQIGGEDARDAKGFYDPATDISYIVFDNISQDAIAKELTGLVAHEISVHALRLGKTDPEFAKLLKQFENMAKFNPAVKAAFARVPKDTPAEHVVEEALAYYIEGSGLNQSFKQKFVAAFRKMLRAIGKSIPVMQRMKWIQWSNKLSEGDIISMATDALRTAPSSLQFDNVGRQGDSVRLAQEQGLEALLPQYATGNNGEFSADNADIRYSKSNTMPSQDAEYSVLNDPSIEEAQSVERGIEGKSAVEAAQFIADNAPDKSHRLIAGKVATRLKDLEDAGAIYHLHVLHDGDQAPSTMIGAGIRGQVYQKYEDPETHIWIQGSDMRGKVGTSYEVVLHELVHAATQKAIDLGEHGAKGELGEASARLINSFNAILNHIQLKIASGEGMNDFEKNFDTYKNNSLQDTHELISWALTNKEMQKYLESIPYKKTTAWGEFVSAVRKFLGLSENTDTVLSEVLAVADKLLSVPVFQIRKEAIFQGQHMQRNVVGMAIVNSAVSKPIRNIVKQGDAVLKDYLSQARKDSLIYNLQDRFIDLKREIEKAIKNGGTVGEANNPYLAEELYHQRAAARIHEFYRDEVNPLLNEMHDNGVSKEQLEEFAHARHAPSRNAVMAERNPNQDMIDSRLADAEINLDEVRSDPVATRKEIGDALAEYNKWNRATAFNGSEEDRLSLSGMSDQDAHDYMASLPTGHRRTLTAMSDQLDAINNNTLDLLVEYGMETPESVKALKEQWEHYVPLHRDEAHPDDNNFGHPVGRGFSVSGSGMKSATGSNAEVTNILAHITAAREQMLRRGEKNIVTKSLADFIRANPDPDFAEIDKLEVDKALNDDGLVESRLEPAFKRNMADNVVMYRVDGKNKAIVYNDKKPENVRLALSLKNLDGANLDAVENLIAKGTRWFAKVNTQYNVVFGVVNLIRDTQGMMLNLTSTDLHGKQLDVLKNMKDAFKAIHQEGRDGANPALQAMYKRFNLAGGTTGYGQMFDDIGARNKSIENELKKLGNSKPLKLAHQLIDSLSLFNNLMENSTRLAVFMTAVNSGMSDAKAASLAKNATVNFNRKGAQSTKIGAFYAFFNASAQGTARLAETLSGKKGKMIIAGGVSLGALTTLMGLAMMGDDDWEKIPEFVRERSLILPIGGDNYISIPMPLGFHLLPNIGRKMVEAAFSSKKSATHRLAELAGSTVGAFNPLGGSDISEFVMPTVLDPALSLWRNKDWTGRSIYKEDFNSLKPTPGFTRAKDTASTPAKLIAEGVNKLTGGTDYKQGAWSPTPDQIDYIFGQLLGGTGREALKLEQSITATITGEELPMYKMPLIGRFAGETSGNAVERSSYYENIKTLNEHRAEIDGLKKDKNMHGALSYARENPEVKLLPKAHKIELSIARLKKRRDSIKQRGNKNALSTIDAAIVKQMKALNDSVAAVNH